MSSEGCLQKMVLNLTKNIYSKLSNSTPSGGVVRSFAFYPELHSGLFSLKAFGFSRHIKILINPLLGAF